MGPKQMRALMLIYLHSKSDIGCVARIEDSGLPINWLLRDTATGMALHI